MSETAWREGLSGLPVTLRYYETIGSSNDAALQWAADGANEYALVVADQQTAGRGRMQRRWVTRPGVALAFSLVLHPTSEEGERITLFSPLAALALCAALSQFTGLQTPGCCQVKWPNDVLLYGRKVAGVLVESSWMGGRIENVVIGMGVNVSPGAVPENSELLFPATSIQAHTRQPVDRIRLLRDVLEQVISFRARMLQEEFIERYNELLAFKGQPVFVQQDERQIQGSLIGVLPSGDLLLDCVNGQKISVGTGDVHLRPA